MDIKAETKYLRISSKKLKALAKAVVGLSADQAMDRLLLAKDKGERVLQRVLKTAYADAKNNFKLDGANLKIKSVEILKGPIMKRWQPVARGVAHQIKKRMSHIKVTLEEIKKGEALSVKR